MGENIENLGWAFHTDHPKILLRLDISLERLSPTELSPEVPSIMTFINYTDEESVLCCWQVTSTQNFRR